ncbi:MAG: hypothetical protein UZ14_CFX002001692, partial [Chloroflexi bacterium OLB14]
GDRDLLQLVNERTAVYLAGDDSTYITDADVVKKIGSQTKTSGGLQSHRWGYIR